MADLEFPAYDPVYPIKKRIRPKQNRMQAPGWGYEQVETTGLNQTTPEWDVKWILYDEDANIIDAFLEECAKTNQIFLWTPPGYPTNRYRCDTWSKSMFDAFASEVNATFRRVIEFENTVNFQFQSGNFSIIGNPANFTFGRFIGASTGAYSIAASSVGFSRLYIMSAATAAYNITGNQIDFVQAVASDYFSSMPLQVYGWDREFQVDWWGD
jgi:phage-related protein